MKCLKNYRPASIFEKFIFNEMFKFFIGNELNSRSQQVFRVITQEICKLFDESFEVKRAFLDILKVLDKV